TAGVRTPFTILGDTTNDDGIGRRARVGDVEQYGLEDADRPGTPLRLEARRRPGARCGCGRVPGRGRWRGAARGSSPGVRGAGEPPTRGGGEAGVAVSDRPTRAAARPT